jgi:hypothetical protein
VGHVDHREMPKILLRTHCGPGVPRAFDMSAGGLLDANESTRVFAWVETVGGGGTAQVRRLTVLTSTDRYRSHCGCIADGCRS